MANKNQWYNPNPATPEKKEPAMSEVFLLS